MCFGVKKSKVTGTEKMGKSCMCNTVVGSELTEKVTFERNLEEHPRQREQPVKRF